MPQIDEILKQYQNQPIVLYGLGIETERFILSHASNLHIIGLLDGFKNSGELYGYPIIPLSSLPDSNVSLIIVIARPGSCKAIAQRIGDFCSEHNTALYDVRGRDLLAATSVTYEFHSDACCNKCRNAGENRIGCNGSDARVGGRDDEDNEANEKNGNNVEVGGRLSRQYLNSLMEQADVVSFDLFDTLVMRKTTSYTDVFELLNLKLRDIGIYIPGFAKLRLYAEKEMSKASAPHLVSIYEKLLQLTGGSFVTAPELAEMEWELDSSLFIPRSAVRDIFQEAIEGGKKVVITTDSYYSRAQIESVLSTFDLVGYDNLFVSCEYGTAKTGELFEEVKKRYPGQSVLHIGDDEYADVEKAREHGIETFRIYSPSDLLDVLGGLGLDDTNSVSDRIKVGLFLSRIFNSPFWFDNAPQRLSVKDASDMGYLFCAPMITDFIIWMNGRLAEEECGYVLFGARDGYLIGRLFRMIADNSVIPFYFLTSRTAAIRAGMDSEADIEYVDSMKFFGSPEEALKVRFGIEVEDADAVDRVAMILEKSKQQRENYRIYIEKLGVGKKRSQETEREQGVQSKEQETIAFFDFVAKGTTQMYLQKLFPQRLKGFYFLRLEPEFMADKGLEIEPFYSDEEKNTSAIFDNYYILETMLTSPYSQILEMDENGRPVFAQESRNETDIEVFRRAQDGIVEYFRDYISIVPADARTVNKTMDEKLLDLVNNVQILDEEFLGIKVEDPFFARMTDIKDVIG